MYLKLNEKGVSDWQLNNLTGIDIVIISILYDKNKYVNKLYLYINTIIK